MPNMLDEADALLREIEGGPTGQASKPSVDSALEEADSILSALDDADKLLAELDFKPQQQKKVEPVPYQFSDADIAKINAAAGVNTGTTKPSPVGDMIDQAMGRPVATQPGPMMSAMSMSPTGSTVSPDGTIRKRALDPTDPEVRRQYRGEMADQRFAENTLDALATTGTSFVNSFIDIAQSALSGAGSSAGQGMSHAKPIDRSNDSPPIPHLPEGENEAYGKVPSLVGHAAGAITRMMAMPNAIANPQMAKAVPWAIKFLRNIPSHAINSGSKFAADAALTGGGPEQIAGSFGSGMLFGAIGAFPATAAATKAINAGVQAAAGKYITQFQGGSKEEQWLNALIAGGMGAAEWMRNTEIDTLLKMPSRTKAKELGLDKMVEADRKVSFDEIAKVRAKAAEVVEVPPVEVDPTIGVANKAKEIVVEVKPETKPPVVDEGKPEVKQIADDSVEAEQAKRAVQEESMFRVDDNEPIKQDDTSADFPSDMKSIMAKAKELEIPTRGYSLAQIEKRVRDAMKAQAEVKQAADPTPAAKQPWEMKKEEFARYQDENPLKQSEAASESIFYRESIENELQQNKRQITEENVKELAEQRYMPDDRTYWDVIKGGESEIVRRETHDEVIKRALSEGRPVPSEVLSEYPELSKPKPNVQPTPKEPVRRKGMKATLEELQAREAKARQELKQYVDARGLAEPPRKGKAWNAWEKKTKDDAKYQRLNKAFSSASVLANKKAAEMQREVAVAEVEAGTVNRGNAKYAPVEAYPDYIAEAIRQDAQYKLDRTKSESAKKALRAIAEGKDKTGSAEIEKWREKIVADLLGERAAAAGVDVRTNTEAIKYQGEQYFRGQNIDPVVAEWFGPNREVAMSDAIKAIDDGAWDSNPISKSLVERMAQDSEFNPLSDPPSDARAALESLLGRVVDIPPESPTASGSPPTDVRQTNLFGIPDQPMTGEQSQLGFSRNLAGEQVTQSGVITKDGKLRPDIDKAAEARIARENAESGQGMLPGSGTPSEPSKPGSDVQGRPVGAGKRSLSLDPLQNRIVSTNEIVTEMRRVSGAPFRTGVPRRLRKVYEAAYNRRSGVARTKVANDLDASAHEFGHAIHDRFAKNKVSTLPPDVQLELDAMGRALYPSTGPNPSRSYLAEGWAEYVARRLWGEDMSTVSPKMDAWFRGTFEPTQRGLKLGLDGLTELFTRYDAQGAMSRAIASFSKTGKPRTHLSKVERARRWHDKIARALWEPFASTARFVREGAKRVPIAYGENPVKFRKMLPRIVKSRAAYALKDGVQDFMTGERLSQGVVDPIRRMGLKTLDQWNEFKAYTLMRTYLARYKLGQTPGPVSQADAQRVVDDVGGRPGWEAAAQAMTGFENALVEMVYRTGRYSQAEKNKIIQSVEDFSPLLRVMDELVHEFQNKVGGGNSPVKKFKGSGEETIDPFAAIEIVSERFHRAAADIIIRQNMVDFAARRKHMGEWIEQVDNPMQMTRSSIEESAQLIKKLDAKDLNTGIVDPAMKAEIERLATEMKQLNKDMTDNDMNVSISLFRAAKQYYGSQPIEPVYRNGNLEWYWMHPDLIRELRGSQTIASLHAALDSTIGKVFTVPTRLVRAGAVTLRPSFGVAFNPVRDVITAMARTDNNAVRAPFRIIGTAIERLFRTTGNTLTKGKIAKDPWAELYDKSGGGMATLVGGDVARAYKMGHDIMREASGTQWRKWMNPLRVIAAPGAFTEGNPRIVEFREHLRKRGYTDEQASKGEIALPDLIEAMYRGANITTDFGTAGEITGLINRIAAFANAPVQDTVNNMRLFRDHPIRTMARGTAILTLPTLAMWWANKDKDWYKELPEWQRWSGFNFEMFGKHVWIPSPFFLGTLFSRFPEHLLNEAYKEQPQVVTSWWERSGIGRALGDMTPGAGALLVDTIAPIIEVVADYDFFRKRSVVPKSVSMLREEDQYTAYTTELAKYWGAKIGFSPAKIDHLMKGYFPVSPDVVNSVTDRDTGRITGLAKILPKDNAGESIQTFYANADTIAKDYNSERARKGDQMDTSLKNEMQRLERDKTIMSKIRSLGRTKDKATAADWQRYQTGLARWSLGMSELDAYPNPLRDPNAPSEIRDIANEEIGNLAYAVTGPEPKQRADERRMAFTARKIEWQAERDKAKSRLNSLDLPLSRKVEALQVRMKRQMMTPKSGSWNERINALKK